jgi:hypothetical protein
MSYYEARKLAQARDKSGVYDPLDAAIKEGALVAEIRKNDGDLWEICDVATWDKSSKYDGMRYRITAEYPEHFDIDLGKTRLSRDDVEKLWPDQPAINGERRGRPSHDWEAFYIEIIRRANTPDGLPDKQADLEQSMLVWCQSKWGKEPGISTVREKISPIYKARK